MTRIKAVWKPSDYPDTTDEAGKKDLAALFANLFPGNPDPEFGKPATGYALAARNPTLALKLNEMGGYIAREMSWCKRTDLRELAIQTANYHLECAGSFEAHMVYAKNYGITAEQQAAIPYWRKTDLFDEEQRLVVEYAEAVVTHTVTDELSARVVARFGEKETLEFTTAVAWWSFWGMILNAF